MKKLDVLIWLSLVTLTLFAFFSSGSNLSPTSIILLIVGATVVKFLGVSFQFMELRKAHVFWKVSMVVLLSSYVGMVLILS